MGKPTSGGWRRPQRREHEDGDDQTRGDAALDALREAPQGFEMWQKMALFAGAWGKIDGPAALEYAKELPGPGRMFGSASALSGWAAVDPDAAIAGMLLPAAGPKGFGLAFIIDLLCGGLSGGGIGGEVRPLFGKLDQPYNCANLFLAIHVGHFAEDAAFNERARASTETISTVERAPGIQRVFAPGEMAWQARASAQGDCALAPATYEALAGTARKAGLDLDELLSRQV